MNILSKIRKQSGVGLIEVLIVLVVLAIAWAAITALQGNLMSGSSTTKARNEALGLALEKTEQMKNSIEKGQYVADLAAANEVSDPDNPIQGVNGDFTRKWQLVPVTLNVPAGTVPAGPVAVDTAMKLVVTVSWTNNESVTENVVLNNIVAFKDPARIASHATGGLDGVGGGGGVAPPNAQTASEGPGGPIVPDSKNLDEDGDPTTTDDNIYTAVDDEGNLVVYQGALVDDAFSNGLTVYGGKILKFSGKIYYDSPAPYVRATSPSFCTTFEMTKTDCGITDIGSSTNCARYVCYAGGDCSNGDDGNGACSHLTADEIAALPTNLNGGWYGKIGDFFPSLSNPQQFPTICMGDSIDVPARLFVTKRVFPGSHTGFEREGINTSFECYDTLISASNDDGCPILIAELTGYGIVIDPNANPNQIADHQIIRSLEFDVANTVLPPVKDSDSSTGDLNNFCGQISSSGSSSSSGGSTYTHACSCTYKSNGNADTVIGTNISTGISETGCCRKQDCDGSASYSCPIP